MKELRDRVLIPLAIPLAAAVVIVIVVLNFSRILLALEVRGSAELATIVAIMAASAVLFGCSWVSARGESRSTGNIGALIVAGLVLVTSGVVGAEAISEHEEEERAHAAEQDVGPPDVTATAGPGLIFAEKELTAPSGDVVIELVNADTGAHTFLFENAAPGFRLEVGSKDDKDKGVAKLEPGGPYTYFCDIPGHRQAGMEGKMTVTEGGGGGGGEAAADLTAVTGLLFEPAEVAVPSGPVKLTLHNEDTQAHTLLVEGQPQFARLDAAQGETAEGTLDVGPGTYVLYCDLPGHRPAGMEATLIVG